MLQKQTVLGVVLIQIICLRAIASYRKEDVTCTRTDRMLGRSYKVVRSATRFGRASANQNEQFYKRGQLYKFPEMLEIYGNTWWYR